MQVVLELLGKLGPKIWILGRLGCKGKGILQLFNVGGQTGKDCLLTWADGVKVADRQDRTRNLSLRKRCTNHLHHRPHDSSSPSSSFFHSFFFWPSFLPQTITNVQLKFFKLFLQAGHKQSWSVWITLILKLIPKTIGNREKEIVREVVCGDKHYLKKICRSQSTSIYKRRLTDLCFVICRFSQVVFITSSNLTHNLFFYFQLSFWY